MIRLPVTMIAAVARNGVIGRDGGMPWCLPGDLAHFRASTLGRPVIMGRRTFEAIGRPLPGRHVVLLSRDARDRPDVAATAHDPEAALQSADAIGRQVGADSIMVAGGAQVYAALVPAATTLLITAVDLTPPGDAVFPPIDPACWNEIETTDAKRRPGDEAGYQFVRYVRRLVPVVAAPERIAR